MRSLLVLFFLLGSVDARSQQLPLLKEALQKGSLSGLNEYIIFNKEVFAHDFPENSMYWRLYREVYPGCSEGTLQIVYCEPYSNWRHKVYPLRVQVLVRDSTIFYYRIMGQDSTGRYDVVRDSAYRQQWLDEFSAGFSSVYGAAPDWNYLFIDSVNYGDSCRGDGTPPDELLRMRDYVRTANTAALNAWLRSGSTELQLFGARGLLEMERKNRPLPPRTHDLIRMILSKQGNINYCLGGWERRIRISRLREPWMPVTTE